MQWWLIFLKGVAMGAADVVPGVSGGTIAFITGIYQRLLAALTSFNFNSLQLLLSKQWKQFWQAIDGRFLFTLLAGILLSLLSLAKIIDYLLTNFSIGVWSFFFGLVAASVLFLLRQVPQWRKTELLLAVLGLVIAVFISLARPAQLPSEWWMMFIAGFVAICAMILPGISGSFILLLMGMYSVVIRALSDFDIALLLSFAIGCGIGLLVFSHLLTWLLKRYFAPVLSLLVGFLAGSLNILWPWKQTLETMVNRHQEVVPVVQSNVLPWHYEALYSLPAHTFWAALLMLAGFFMVIGLERVGQTLLKE